ncbi:hypothetical protein P0R28_01825 [Bradyrhizobium yuanmingense]|nr:hypothetical protein [Bradyrhizobium yuanmingense]
MPALKWSLISNQDGRGCIYQAGRGDTMMLSVFRNPDKDRARELYATFVKTLGERMPLSAVSGIGDEGQGGTSAAGAERQEASVVALSGDYILQISVYPIGRRADDALLGPIIEAARVAVGNVSRSSERFGNCEWLTAADADGFLDNSTLTVQRTGAGSCMMFDREANTMTVAVITTSRDTALGMMKRRPLHARGDPRARPRSLRRAFLYQGQRQRRQHPRLEERPAGLDPVRPGQAASAVRLGRTPEGGRRAGVWETVRGRDLFLQLTGKRLRLAARLHRPASTSLHLVANALRYAPSSLASASERSTFCRLMLSA